jgi:hypothetical protein
MKRPALLLIPLAAIAVLLTFAGIAWAAQVDTARFAPWPDAFFRMNGSPVHRSTVVATAATPKDTTSTSGGASVAYTFFGGERVCIQTAAAAYVEVIAAASMTASGGKAFTVNANEPLLANCFTLLSSETKISVDCITGTCSAVKVFELR